MRYHYKPLPASTVQYGTIYICDHPVYNECTLYKIGGLGLAVIQQRYDPDTKRTYWTAIDSNLVDDLYLKEGFLEYFRRFAKPVDEQGLYPTVSVRQLMWGLRLKPLKRSKWETLFDKAPI